MDQLNNISKIYFSEYILKHNVYIWYKLLFMDKNFLGYALYNLVQVKDRDYGWLIYYAAEKGYLNIIKTLIVLSINKDFIAAIDIAIHNMFKYQLNIIKILASSSTNTDYRLIIKYAAEQNRLDIIDILQPYNTNSDYRDIMLILVKSNNLGVLTIIESLNTNKNYLPLISYAVVNNNLDMVRLLVENNEDTNIFNCSSLLRSSLFAMAQNLGYNEIYQYLYHKFNRS